LEGRGSVPAVGDGWIRRSMAPVAGVADQLQARFSPSAVMRVCKMFGGWKLRPRRKRNQNCFHGEFGRNGEATRALAPLMLAWSLQFAVCTHAGFASGDWSGGKK